MPMADCIVSAMVHGLGTSTTHAQDDAIFVNPSGTAARPQNSIGRRSLAPGIVASAFVLGLACLDGQIAAQLASDLQWTEHTLAVQAKIRAVGALVSDMEAG